MLINNYLQSFKLEVQKLEDYGLVRSLDDLTEVRSEKTAYLCMKVILIDLSELYIKEYLSTENQKINKLSYSYQYQRADKSLLFRYDNAKHKPDLGFSEHKHNFDGSIIPHQLPEIAMIVEEVINYLS